MQGVAVALNILVRPVPRCWEPQLLIRVRGRWPRHKPCVLRRCHSSHGRKWFRGCCGPFLPGPTALVDFSYIYWCLLPFVAPPASSDPFIGGFSGPLRLSSSVDDSGLSPWGVKSNNISFLSLPCVINTSVCVHVWNQYQPRLHRPFHVNLKIAKKINWTKKGGVKVGKDHLSPCLRPNIGTAGLAISETHAKN